MRVALCLRGEPSSVWSRVTAILRAAVICALVLLVGCKPESYPESLSFPLREDPLVVSYKEERDIQSLGPLGDLEYPIRELQAKARGNPKEYKILDPTELSADEKKNLKSALDDMFGTPAHPQVQVKNAALFPIFDRLLLDDPALERGSTLFRRHCLHCHGLSGDGRGPTAPWVHPSPRDYRRGYFKFTSVNVSASGGLEEFKPLRSDLLRTLREGVEGTSMTNFRDLKDIELEDLVSYVIFLSIRGNVEFEVMRKLLDPDTPDKEKNELSEKIAALVNEETERIVGQWNDQVNPPIEPEKPPFELTDKAAMEKGYDLFAGKAGCRACHVDFGRQAGFLYDKWGTLARPNNLTQGVYRGGRRPIDMYFRIHSGINPSTMPAQSAALKPEEIWQLVAFVRTLPYPDQLPEKVRKDVYGR